MYEMWVKPWFSTTLVIQLCTILLLQAYRKYSYFVAILDATWQSLVEFFVPYFVSANHKRKQSVHFVAAVKCVKTLSS